MRVREGTRELVLSSLPYIVVYQITGEVIQELYGGGVKMVRHDQPCKPGDPTCLDFK